MYKTFSLYYSKEYYDLKNGEDLELKVVLINGL